MEFSTLLTAVIPGLAALLAVAIMYYMQRVTRITTGQVTRLSERVSALDRPDVAPSSATTSMPERLRLSQANTALSCSLTR